MIMVSAAVLVAAGCVYFVTRPPGAESLRMATVGPRAADEEFADAEPSLAPEGPATETVRWNPVAEQSTARVSAIAGTKVLRVVLEGFTEENARMARVTLTGVDRRAFDPRLATVEERRSYVQWVQESLNRVLGTQLAVDGELGSVTHQAILSFQGREGLPMDGRVGPKTEGALIRHVGTHLPAPQWPPEIRDSWLCQGLTSEFDLDRFFAVVGQRHEDVRVDELEVEVDHPLHLLETTRLPLNRGVEQESGQTVYEVRVRLVSAAVIHGRLERDDGAPAAMGLVGAVLLEGGFPIEDVACAVECGADGAFELRVTGSGPHALASFEDGRRPTTTHVEALVGTRVDVGTLVLEFGHEISGHVLRQGNPATGASVYSTPPRWRTAATPEAISSGLRTNVYEGRTFTTPARSIHLLWLTPATSYKSLLGPRRGGRFELNRQWVDVDENGAFVVGGLGSIEYLLRMGGLAEVKAALPGYWGDGERDDEMIYINGGKAALPVRAPEQGVVLEFKETSIRFELGGDLVGEDEGRLVLKTRSAHPTPVDENGKDLRLVADPLAKNLNFTPEFHTRDFPVSGEESTYVLQAPPNKHMTGEFAFPGRQPVPLDFRTPKPGGELVIPIRLVRAEELATLVIDLESPQAEIPEAFTVLLWRAGLEEAPPDMRQVEVSEAQLRVEGLFPGKYRVRVRPGVDRHFPTGLFFEYELDLELHPDREISRSIMLQRCAGLRVTVRDEDGELVGGEFELFDHLGGRATLLLEVGEGQRRGYSYSSIYPYGTHESANPLKPGSYQLVILSPIHPKRSVRIELRAGEYEDVEVTLSK